MSLTTRLQILKNHKKFINININTNFNLENIFLKFSSIRIKNNKINKTKKNRKNKKINKKKKPKNFKKR